MSKERSQKCKSVAGVLLRLKSVIKLKVEWFLYDNFVIMPITQ